MYTICAAAQLRDCVWLVIEGPEFSRSRITTMFWCQATITLLCFSGWKAVVAAAASACRIYFISLKYS